MPDLPRIFIRHRLQLGLTQQEVAELSAVSVRLLRELEAGRANPGMRQLERIANVLNLTLALVPLVNENSTR